LWYVARHWSDHAMPEPRRAQLVFTVALAVLGWGALAAAALVGPPLPAGPGAAGVALLVAVIVATRALAFYAQRGGGNEGCDGLLVSGSWNAALACSTCSRRRST
jgi:hypothetical protein